MSNSDKEFNFKVLAYCVIALVGLAIAVNVLLTNTQSNDIEKTKVVLEEANLPTDIPPTDDEAIESTEFESEGPIYEREPSEPEQQVVKTDYVQDEFEKRDPHAPHPWFEVNPSAEDLRKCRALERKPLPFVEYYDSEQSRMLKKYHPKFTYKIWVRSNGKNYAFENVFRNKRGRERVRDNLNKTLFSMYEDYIALLGGETLYQAHVDIVIAWDSDDYSEILTYYNAEHLISKSAGIYFPQEHLAVSRLPRTIEGYIDWPEFNDTMAHETGHAMDFVQFGYKNRWASEGLAQFHAHKVNAEHPSLFISREEWLRVSEGLAYPYPFESLLEVSEEWLDNMHQLYATTFAYTQYFATQRPDILKQVLRLEQEQLCASVNKAVLSSIVDPDSMLYTDMQNWFDSKLSNYNAKKAELDKRKAEK
jgi:hypothetical protein